MLRNEHETITSSRQRKSDHRGTVDASIGPESHRDGSILHAGHNCWRVSSASRAACLVDGDAYFDVAKRAMLRARHSILLLAWDFAERTRLNPGSPDPAGTDRIGDLLQTLVDRRKDLEIRVLVWDKAAWLALRRRRIPGVQVRHLDRDRLRYVLDREHPALSCHHQKVLVIDDAVAFCGGFDFATNRWDTRAHHRHDPRRRKPSGQPYTPHHDVMMLVDGEAARSLGDLARTRWWRATGERLSPPPPGADPWPADLAPDLRDVRIGIARTEPAWRDRPEVREVERLYLDAIAAARDTIYMESQYFASHQIGDALARRLVEPHGPEIVIVNPKRAPSWIEEVAMDDARTEIVRHLGSADRFGRFRLYAALTDEAEIIIHSKVMVVDDRLLRIGSANLNNRSMGTDTECDLAIEAMPGMPDDAAVRRGVRRIRDGLVAEHLGVPAERLSTAVDGHGSLVRAIEDLNGSSGRQLAEFARPRPGWASTLAHDRLTDPLSPPGMRTRRRSAPGRGNGMPGTLSIIALAAVVGFAAFRWGRPT